MDLMEQKHSRKNLCPIYMEAGGLKAYLKYFTSLAEIARFVSPRKWRQQMHFAIAGGTALLFPITALSNDRNKKPMSKNGTESASDNSSLPPASVSVEWMILHKVCVCVFSVRFEICIPFFRRAVKVHQAVGNKG